MSHAHNSYGRHSASTSRSAVIITPSIQEKGINNHAQNTYKLEPDVVFPARETQRLVEEMLEEELKDKQYSHSFGNDYAKQLANKIKQKVMSLNYTRYRIVTFVAIGQKENGTIKVASRCLWNQSHDTFTEAAYSNQSLYAVAVVYAVYLE